jgi:hypothetical protein
MTGQVKEEVLTRLGELGLRVEDGRIVFRPLQLRDTEWLAESSTFDVLDVAGQPVSLELPAGSLGFTFCQVPVVYARGADLSAAVHLRDGAVRAFPDGAIPADLSGSVFGRDGLVERIEVQVPTS